MVYRHRLGSGPAEQWKKVDLAGNPAVRWRPELEVFLQPTGAVPNLGTKSGEREEEDRMNNPRAPRGVHIVGERGWWLPALEKP
jgi:hypothetical protein